MRYLAILLTIFLSTQLFGHSNGPVNTRGLRCTGAPGETTCGSCHVGGNYNGDIAFDDLSSADLFSWGYYTPGQQYFISCYVISQSPFPEGGIQFRAIDDYGNPRGFFLPGNTSNSSQAPIRYRYMNGVWHQYVEHPSPITPNLANGAYRIQIIAAWRAGNFDTGPTHFYASGALCDGNDSVTNDNSFFIQQTVYEDHPLGFSPDSLWPVLPVDQRIVVDLGVLSDPKLLDDDIIGFKYYSYEGDVYQYRLYDAAGKLVTKGKRTVPQGEGEERIRITGLTAGIYQFQIVTSRGGSTIAKILKY